MRLLAPAVALCCGVSALCADDPPPGPQQQAAMLAAMARYAEHYQSSIPNFLCLEVTEQFTSGSKAKRWRRGDTLTSRLAFSEGQERRTLELVNNKPIHWSVKLLRTPLTTQGQFGPALAAIFADSSHASFEWSHWDTLRGHRAAVFDYSIDKQHSQMKLSLSDIATAIVPYHGSIEADPDTGSVWRISFIASNLPPELHQKGIANTVDFELVTIANSQYLLPVHATIVATRQTELIRNEIQLSEYRKFTAESSLKFDTAPADNRPTSGAAQPQP